MTKNSIQSIIAAAFICLGCTQARADGTQTLNFTFSTDAENWVANQSTGSSFTVGGGHLNCTMGLQSNNKYRGDLWYNNSSDASLNVTLDPTTDVYLAVKFIGTRPSGALKLEMAKAAGGWFNTAWNGGSANGNISTFSNNKIYYFLLTNDATFTEATEISRIHIVVADADVAPFEYSVDWIATFASLADLEAYKDTQDDGPSDADDTAIDPATLDGYMYYPFLSGADGWTNSTTQKVFRNNDKLIVKNTVATNLQARKNGVPNNAANFPYLAVKVDALPAGFDVSNFHIQTNCSGIGVYDSWYSVVEQKGDVYVFDMTSCKNKNSGADQNAILTTNNADMWIDFGNIAADEVAQIGWVKTFQTLAEIAAETADPLLPEASVDAGSITFDFDEDHASNTTWAWRTAHWQDGERGCKVSAESGQLNLTPNSVSDDQPQAGAYTRTDNGFTLLQLNSNNYPYFAVKVDDMGDAGYFKLTINSITKGDFTKNNLDPSVTVKGTNNNIYVFDLSSYLMFNTASDVSVRLDFYQGTSGTTNPTTAVKIDWIHSYKTLEEIVDIPTNISDFTIITDDFRYYSGNGVLNIVTEKVQNVNIYGIDGRLCKQTALVKGENSVTLPQGVYIINHRKVIVK